MKFTPKNDDQFAAEQAERLAKYAPWPNGTVVDYKIITSSEGLSKIKADGSGGNPMITLGLEIFNDKGESKEIDYYLGDWNEWSLKRICEANAMLDRYEAGQVDDYDLGGKVGKCVLGIQKGGPRSDGTGNYPDKNVIKEFLKIVGTKPATDIPYELDDSVDF